jgi:hypothetical protein
MYSKAEATQLRQAFWTAFGQYMAPVPSAEGESTNWINYKTGIKHVYFRMQADNRRASIGIELTHPDAGIRELFFEQFLEVKTVLHEALGEQWTWEADATDAQGSGLLVMASYNWGEDRVIRLIQSMPVNPRERNFWQLLTKYRDRIPQETYDYVFYIISAAVIGENPRLFGFDFDNPLTHLESK